MSARDAWTPIMPVPDDAPPIPQHRFGTPSATWDYRDPKNRLLFRVFRFDPPNSKKKVLPFCYSKSAQGEREWRQKAPRVPRPLYGLEALAARPGAPVVVCEGEKTADAAARLFPDYVAMTSQGGSNAAARSGWTALRGRRVVICPDHDDVGRKYAADVAGLCTSAGAAEVQIVELPRDFPEKWDLADEPPCGWDTARLRTLLESARPFAGETGKSPRKSEPKRGQGRALQLSEPEPWSDPVDGRDLLNALHRAVRQHVVLDAAAACAIALWIVGTFAFDNFSIFPRLAITSPEKGCGKTTLLDVLSRLVNRPLLCANITAPALFRTVEEVRPTLLVDEADTFLRNNEELRGVLNAGHRWDGQIIRVVGDNHEPRIFSAWAPAAVAAIGRLPDTLADRSIAISLRRRRVDEAVVPLRLDCTSELDSLARMAARYVCDYGDALAAADPVMPDSIINRAADNWRPLFAIADAAGGEWSERARSSARSLLRHGAGEDESIRVQLLADIQRCFDTEPRGILFSEEIVTYLKGLEDGPWLECGPKGNPMTANRLARLLKPLGVSPGAVRRKTETGKGYMRVEFDDAFARYLPVQTVTPSQTQQNRVPSDDSKPSHGTGCDGSKSTENPHDTTVCDGVTVQKPEEYEFEL